MPITFMPHHEDDWRPRTLRFGHWRDGERVGFAADHAARGPGGHDASDRFALMAFLARVHPACSVEVDGVFIHGHLDVPDDEQGRTAFHPRPFPDGSLPHPTRHRCWIRWKADGVRHIAECPLDHPDPGGPWLLGVPRSVESDDRRLLPRVRPEGWALHVGPHGPVGLEGAHPVVDASPVGVAVTLPGALPDAQVLGHTFIGELLPGALGPQRVQLEARYVLAGPAGARVGFALHGAGYAGLRRLVALLYPRAVGPG